MVDSRRLASPTAMTATPARAATNPSRTPVCPRAPFTGDCRRCTGERGVRGSSLGPVRGGDPPRMLGDVGRRVLDQDLLGQERRAAEVADGDDRDAGGHFGGSTFL